MPDVPSIMAGVKNMIAKGVGTILEAKHIPREVLTFWSKRKQTERMGETLNSSKMEDYPHLLWICP